LTSSVSHNTKYHCWEHSKHLFRHRKTQWFYWQQLPSS